MRESTKEIKGDVVPGTQLDRAIEYVAPSWALKRRLARWEGHAVARADAYIGGATNRTATRSFRPGGGDANEDSLMSLQMLRNRSSWHLRNTSILIGMLNTKCAYGIGPGLTLQSRIDWKFLGINEKEAATKQDDIERAWKLFGETTNCDIEKKHNIYGLQALTFRSPFERGDCFVLLTHKEEKGIPFSLKLQLVEADRVCNDPKVSTRDTSKLIAGMVLNKHAGPTHIHIRTTHPGSTTGKYIRKWVHRPIYGPSGTKNILHLWNMQRVGQVRGVPLIAPIIEPFYELNKGLNGEMAATAIQGNVAMILQKAVGELNLQTIVDTNKTQQKPNEDYKLPGVSILSVKNTDDVKSFQPTRPNGAFTPFLQGMYETYAPCTGLPYEVFVMHYTRSFSAARSALLQHGKGVDVERARHIHQFDDPVFAAATFEAVSRGMLVLPGFLESPAHRQAWLGRHWQGPAAGNIDETKAITAARERIELTLTTHSGEAAKINEDWEKNIAQLIREEKLIKELRELRGGNQAATDEDTEDTEDVNVDDTNEGVDGRDGPEGEDNG